MALGDPWAISASRLHTKTDKALSNLKILCSISLMHLHLFTDSLQISSTCGLFGAPETSARQSAKTRRELWVFRSESLGPTITPFRPNTYEQIKILIKNF